MHQLWIWHKSNFDYEQDGFGEVVYDLDTLVEMIISYMQNNCTLKKVYRERIEGFFAYNDYCNCQRVYEKTCDLMGLECKA